MPTKALRLSGDFPGRNNRQWRYKIYSDLGSATSENSPKLLSNGMTFRWESGDELSLTEAIMPMTAELSFICEHNDQLNLFQAFMQGGEEETVIEIRDDSGWSFYGCIVPEASSFELTGGATRVDVTFTDGLGLLKAIQFKKSSDDSLYTTGTSALYFIHDTLKKLPWWDQFMTSTDVAIRETKYLTTDQIESNETNPDEVSLANRILIHPNGLYQRKEQRYRFRPIQTIDGVENCYDALHDILQTLGSRICWNGHEFHIFSVLNFSHMAQGHLQHDTATWTNATIDANPWDAGTYESIAPYATLDQTHEIVAGAVRGFSPIFTKGLSVHENAPVGELEIPVSLEGGVHSSSGDKTWVLDNSRIEAYDPDLDYEDDVDLTLTAKATIGHRYAQDGALVGDLDRLGLRQCFIVKLTTTIGGIDYVLNGPVKHYSEGFRIERPLATDVTGAKTWDYFDEPTWIPVADIDNDPTSKPGLLYIPFQSLDDYADDFIDTLTYGNKQLPCPAYTKLASGETNVARFEAGNDFYHIDISYAVPDRPGDAEGFRMRAGFALFHRDNTEVVNSIDHIFAADWQDKIGEGHKYEMDMGIDKLSLSSTSSDTGNIKYWSTTDDLGLESIELINTRVASDRYNSSGPAMLNHWYNDLGTIRYTRDIDWTSTYVGIGTFDSNLDLLNEAWLRYYSTGIETLSGDFVLESLNKTAHDIFTPDKALVTGCVGGGTTVLLPYKLGWTSDKGYEGDYIVTNKLHSAVVITPDEEISGNGADKPGGSADTKPYNFGNKSKVGGLNITVDAHETELATARGGGADLDSRFLAIETFDANVENGLLSLSSALGDTGYIVDGTYNGIKFDETGAANGHYMVYDLSTDTWKPQALPTIPTELPDLDDVDATVSTATTGESLVHDGTNFKAQRVEIEDLSETQSPFADAIIQRNAGNTAWTMVSPATIGGTIDLVDLGDVDGADTPATGDVIKWNANGNGKWAFVPETTADLGVTDLNDVTLSGNNSTLSTGDVLQWNDGGAGAGYWEDIDGATFKRNINIHDLADFDFAGTPGTGDTIEWDGSEWTFAANGSGGGGGAADLHDLTDVTISSYVAGSSSPANGKILLTETGTFKDIDLTTATTDYVDVEDLRNVNATGRATGDLMYFNGTNWTPIDLGSLANSALYGMNHADLNDTTITGLGAGQFLYYNGGTWVNQTVNEVRAHLSLEDSDIDARIAAANITDLNDVTSAPTGAGEILYFNGSSWQNAALTVATGLHVDLADLKDTTIGTLASGEYLRWNGSAWVNSNPAILAGSITLQNIGNVTNSPVDGEFLKWDSTSSTWVTDAAGGGSVTVNDAADSTTYDVVMATGNSLYDTQGTGTFEFTTGSAGSVTTATVSNTSNSARLGLYQHPTTGIAGLLYNDSASQGRYMLMAENNEVFLTNRAASGTVGMKVSGSSAGSTGEWTPLSIDGGNGGWTINAQEAATGAAASEDTVMTIKHPAVGGNADIVKIDTSYDGGGTSVPLALKSAASRSWLSFEDNHSGGVTSEWKLVGANQDNIALRTDNTGGKVQLVAPSGVLIESTIDGGGYTLPATDGTSNQVLTTNGSGTVTWATPSGGGSSNPRYNFDQTCYNSVTTTTDTYYWMPGSTTYGFEFYDNNELSSLSTTGTWNRYKKMSHRLPAGTYDMDIYMDMSVSASTAGTSHASDYAGDTVNVYVYKVAHTSNGDCTVTQIGTTNLTLNATDTAAPSTATISLSGQSIAAGERVMVVCKGNTVAAGTRYAHWAYDIDAEKTA